MKSNSQKRLKVSGIFSPYEAHVGEMASVDQHGPLTNQRVRRSVQHQDALRLQCMELEMKIAKAFALSDLDKCATVNRELAEQRLKLQTMIVEKLS